MLPVELIVRIKHLVPSYTVSHSCQIKMDHRNIFLKLCIADHKDGYWKEEADITYKSGLLTYSYGRDKSTVLECYINPEQIPPDLTRLKLKIEHIIKQHKLLN